PKAAVAVRSAATAEACRPRRAAPRQTPKGSAMVVRAGTPLLDRDRAAGLGRPERPLFHHASAANGDRGALGDLVPQAGQVGEGLGDDDAVVRAEPREPWVLRVEMLDRVD